MKYGLLILKLLALAYLGYFIYFFLTTNGPAAPAYHPPFIVWVTDTINLFIHEAGHFFLKPFGMWIYLLGGSFMQCFLPLALAIVVGRQNLANAPLPAFWWITVFYMDVRAFGKGFEEFYDRVRQEGILYRRGNPSEIIRRGDHLIVRAEDTLLGEQVEVEAELVVLAVGMLPREDAGELAETLHIDRSSDGYFLEATPNCEPSKAIPPGSFWPAPARGRRTSLTLSPMLRPLPLRR